MPRIGAGVEKPVWVEGTLSTGLLVSSVVFALSICAFMSMCALYFLHCVNGQTAVSSSLFLERASL